MSRNNCVMCGNKHDDYAWKNKKWGDKSGWACSKWFKPRLHEHTTQQIKDDRAKYFNSTVQPYREGELSKEYLDAHGTKGVKATKKEIKKAKNVWKGISGWGNRTKSL